MPKLHRIAFQRGETAYAMKKFRASGRVWEPGMPFPWRQLALHETQVRRFYDMRLLCHEAELADYNITEGPQDPEPIEEKPPMEVEIPAPVEEQPNTKGPEVEMTTGDDSSNIAPDMSAEPAVNLVIGHDMPFEEPPSGDWNTTEDQLLDMLTTPSETGVE